MMEEIKNILTYTVNVLEQDNRGVQLGCYSVALIGLGIAVRRVRPFSRFRKPSDIPSHFIKERRELTGIVERIEPNGALLMINHKPLVTIPGYPRGQLPVKISGVDVSGLGLSWLQAIVAGSEVRFIPVWKDEKFVQCQVLLSQTLKNQKQETLNVGESLVRIGFGNVVEMSKPIPDKHLLSYYNTLQHAENYAIRKRLGLKYYLKPTKTVLAYLGQAVNRLVFGTYRQIILIPKMSTS